MTKEIKFHPPRRAAGNVGASPAFGEGFCSIDKLLQKIEIQRIEEGDRIQEAEKRESEEPERDGVGGSFSPGANR